MSSPLIQKSSTATTTSLVETVNINVEDFSETFLTCSTCLYTYDQDTRKPKLLPCSHSVCLSCLTQLASRSGNSEPPSLKCPLCREICVLPPGGVPAFPASFFINQLLDVMQKQRKDFVPSCTNHPSDQLLYCETCDLVFCEQCSNSGNNKKCHEHTVIPLSIAIKRTSEIVVYRSKGRLRALDNAKLTVTQEIEKLDQNADKIVEQINNAIQEVSNLVENRRRELIETVRVRRDEKRKVLKDQIEAIHDEKKKLERELESCQLDIRSMARKLKDPEADENWQRQIIEPRENAFLKINTNSTDMLIGVEKDLSEFGKLHASTTFPGTSTIEPHDRLGIHIENVVKLVTRDVHGKQRNVGLDPIEAELTLLTHKIHEDDKHTYEIVENPPEKYPVAVNDNGDGTYELTFKVPVAGEFQLSVNIFGRPVKNSPLDVTVLRHHQPLWQLPVQLLRPTKVVIDENKLFHILDSGNNRLRIAKENGDVVNDITNGAFKGGTCVGLVVLGNDQYIVLNWEQKALSRINSKGDIIQSAVFSEFDQPIDLCMDAKGRLVIADVDKVFVFDQQLRPMFSFPVKSLNDGKVNCVARGLDGDILVGTSTELLLYDGTGKKLREVHAYAPKSLYKRYHGKVSIISLACCQQTGVIIAAVLEKRTNQINVRVISYKGVYQYGIDARGPKYFSGPTGLFLNAPGFKQNQFYVADHMTDSVRMYKFK